MHIHNRKNKLTCKHDDDRYPLVPDHAPEAINGIGLWCLCSYVHTRTVVPPFDVVCIDVVALVANSRRAREQGQDYTSCWCGEHVGVAIQWYCLRW